MNCKTYSLESFPCSPVTQVVVGFAVPVCVGVEMESVVVEMGKGVECGVGEGATVVEEPWRR